MQNAPFGEAYTQNAPFRESDTPRVRLSVSRRLQGGALVHAAATRFAEASTHTNPRRAPFLVRLLHGQDSSLGVTYVFPLAERLLASCHVDTRKSVQFTTGVTKFTTGVTRGWSPALAAGQASPWPAYIRSPCLCVLTRRSLRSARRGCQGSRIETVAFG